MTGLQKVFFGVGVLAIVGLGILVYKQMAAPTVVAPAPNTSRQDVPASAKRDAAPAPQSEAPATPDAVVDDITKEIDADNSTLNDETQGETSQIDADGNAVSDFNTVYEENAK